MKINETTINCCKPNKYISFKGEEENNSPERKVRYKHYEQMSDELLALQSILKAHKDVQNSNKMRIFEAMPKITTTLLGTTIALTQPGRLASKAAAGLGFLALSKAINVTGNKIIQKSTKPKKEEKKDTKKTLIKAGKFVLGLGAFALSVVAFKKFKISSFIQKEVGQLAKEINSTSLGKLVEEKVLPFTTKHAKAVDTFGAFAPLGIIGASSLAQLKLADSLATDIEEKTKSNFAKGKLIQSQARAHFDSIDAQEV